ncbi:amino acid--tRNA ligase-related protein, partial [Arthrospira platensis SPKY1]|nr:amino acid--tRNA ligase-related protein [Arthrospira platensis SPKY1]
MADKAGAQAGDLVLILAGKQPEVFTQCGDLRLMLAREFDLIPQGEWNFLWVTDFPLVEWDEESQRYHALHHPFTSPKPEHLDWMKTQPAQIKARAYDLVLNGNEIG